MNRSHTVPLSLAGSLTFFSLGTLRSVGIDDVGRTLADEE
jgi:hypothetical protein